MNIEPGEPKAQACVVSFACLSATLPRIYQWWAESREYGEGQVESTHTKALTCGVRLSRAVASVFASAVETRAYQPLFRTVSRMESAISGQGGSVGPLGTPRVLGHAMEDFENYRGEPSPAFGRWRTHNHYLPGSAIASSAMNAHPHAPRRFRSAISALCSVPMVQPELVRALHAVLERFPRAPTRVLERATLDDWNQENVREALAKADGRRRGEDGDGSDQRGEQEDMAPPLPRVPSGKRRRVSLDPVCLRATAAGRDGDGDGEDQLHRMHPLRRHSRTLSTSLSPSASLFSEQERFPLFSGDSAACEAVDEVLARAHEALVFFETKQGRLGVTTKERDTVTSDDLSHPARDDGSRGLQVGGERKFDQQCGLLALLRHTASVTCALRMLAPFIDTARLARATRPDRGEGSRRASLARNDEHSGRPDVEGTSISSRRLPTVFGRLADGFALAVQAAERYKVDKEGHVHDGGTAGNADSDKSVKTVASRIVTWIWDLLVTCAGTLPFALLDYVQQHNNIDGSDGDYERSEREHHTRIGLPTAIVLAAKGGLDVSLAPEGSAVLDAALEVTDVSCMHNALSSVAVASTLGTAVGGQIRRVRAMSLWEPGLLGQAAAPEFSSRATSTILGTAALQAPFVLRCFLLVAVTSTSKRMRLDAGRCPQKVEDGVGDQSGRPQEKASESKASDHDKGDEACNSTITALGGESNSARVQGELFGSHDAFLVGLRHGAPLIRQSAVAALPFLDLIVAGVAHSDARYREYRPATKEIAGATSSSDESWKEIWLPALHSLVVDGDEAVRLELAAALPRIGASLRQARCRKDSCPLLPPPPPPPHVAHKQDITGQLQCGEDFVLLVGPTAFADLLSLWQPLLKDENAAVRASAAQGALTCASASPLSQLRETAGPGRQVLRCLVDMLACGDPEVAWVVAGGAGQLVANEGKILRTLYAKKDITQGGSGSEGGKEGDSEVTAVDVDEGRDAEEDDGEDTLGEEEERQREMRLRERALSRFIEAVGALLREHGERLRLGRWQSLHEFTALLRAVG